MTDRFYQFSLSENMRCIFFPNQQLAKLHHTQICLNTSQSSQRHNTMVVTSRFQVDVPEQPLQEWVFGSSFGPLSEKPQFLDAERPETHHLSMADYRLWSKRVALGLVRAGLRPGDRVLVFSGNNLFFPVLFMGSIMAGGVFSGANPSFVVRELAYQLRDTEATFLFAADSSLEIALEAAGQAKLSRNNVFVFDATGLDSMPAKGRLGVKHWTTLLASKDEAKTFDWVTPKNPRETVCCLNYRYVLLSLVKSLDQ